MKREAQHKACQNMPPKPSKIQPSAPTKPPKSRSGASRRGKIPPGNDPDQPRDAQERPRSGQEAPKKRPRRAKRCPRAPKSRPRSAPDPSKSEAGEPQDKFLACSCGEVLRERLVKRFCIVFDVGALRAICKKPKKTYGKLWFLHIRSFVALQARVHEKTLENKALGRPKPSPDPPGTLQNRPRSAPRRQKTDQKQGQTQQERKMRPRSAQERKIVPTWPQETLKYIRALGGSCLL